MNKMELKKRFLDFGNTIEPPFIPDDSLKGKGVRGFAAMKRCLVPGQWQFLAVSKHSRMSQFFVEVGLSPFEAFPIEADCLTPEHIQYDNLIRFRASYLWSRRADGWIINDRNPMEFEIFLIIEYAQLYGLDTGEGIFGSLDEAFEDMKPKIIKWVLPYFDNAAKM